MAVLTTSTPGFNVPTQILDPWLQKVSNGSVISALSNSIPMKFGSGQAFIFGTDEAEYVGEGQNKSSSDFTNKTQTVEPFKFQKTVRMTDEVTWAEEDHRLGIVEQVLAEIQPALSRALDYGVIHGINPRTGTAVAAMTQKLAGAASVEAADGAAPYLAVDAADALVLAAGNVPSDLALDPSFAVTFAQQRDSDGRKIYPALSYGTDPSELEGHRTAVSKTVGANGVAETATDILGVVGDFSAVRWGVQKQIGLEMIRYGDPDGNGDLQRNNQVAFRAEVVYGWGIADLEAFAVIKKPADAEGN